MKPKKIYYKTIQKFIRYKNKRGESISIKIRYAPRNIFYGSLILYHTKFSVNWHKYFL